MAGSQRHSLMNDLQGGPVTPRPTLGSVAPAPSWLSEAALAAFGGPLEKHATLAVFPSPRQGGAQVCRHLFTDQFSQPLVLVLLHAQRLSLIYYCATFWTKGTTKTKITTPHAGQNLQNRLHAVPQAPSDVCSPNPITAPKLPESRLQE